MLSVFLSFCFNPCLCIVVSILPLCPLFKPAFVIIASASVPMSPSFLALFAIFVLHLNTSPSVFFTRIYAYIEAWSFHSNGVGILAVKSCRSAAARRHNFDPNSSEPDRRFMTVQYKAPLEAFAGNISQQTGNRERIWKGETGNSRVLTAVTHTARAFSTISYISIPLNHTWP